MLHHLRHLHLRPNSDICRPSSAALCVEHKWQKIMCSGINVNACARAQGPCARVRVCLHVDMRVDVRVGIVGVHLHGHIGWRVGAMQASACEQVVEMRGKYRTCDRGIC